MMPHEWPKTKSYVAGKDLFLFSVFCIVTKKTGNTGAGKLCGRAHPMADGVYLLYRLLEDDSTKSYGEEKTNRNSTDNIIFLLFPVPVTIASEPLSGEMSGSGPRSSRKPGRRLRTRSRP